MKTKLSILNYMMREMNDGMLNPQPKLPGLPNSQEKQPAHA